MKHLFSFLFPLIVLFNSAAYAQTPGSWRIGFGIDAGAATSDAFKYTLGGDIRIQKDFNQHFSGTITTGFTHFFEKDHFAAYNQYGSPYNVIPVKLGVKYFVTGNLYAGAEAGAGFAFEQWGTSFLWSPSVGLAFNNGIDLSVKYEDYTKDKATKKIALRLAYGFGSRKLVPHKKHDEPKGWQWGISLNPGLNTSAFEGFVLGGELNLSKYLTSNTEVTFSGGYTHSFRQLNYFTTYDPSYTGNYESGGYNEKNVIPVKAGLRLYLGDQFYLGGEAGVAFAPHGHTAFLYTPSLGLKFKSGLDIGIKYDNYSSYRIIDAMSVKVGYHFKLK